MTLREILQEEVDLRAKFRDPALMARFVLRNGKSFTPRPRIGRRRRKNHCFMNSTHFVNDHGGTYVEGYAMRETVPLPLQHAWVTIDGTDAMDPTLPAEALEYLGVPFPTEVLKREIRRTGVYGLLDIGGMLNANLMFEIDPELKRICDDMRTKREVPR